MIVAYFDCFSGISGDMVLGALLDAGLSQELLFEELGKLGLEGYKLEITKKQRGSIRGTRVQVRLSREDAHSRTYSDVREMIEKSGLDERDKGLSLRILERLARAEAAIHGIDPDRVTFHEIGAVDSVVDIVGASIGLNRLGEACFVSSSLPLGRGFVSTRHGALPLPAPATMELLKGVPVEGAGVEFELVTPTGAAILTTVARSFGGLPRMRPERIGHGVGTRHLPDRPNVLRLVIGRQEASSSRQDVVIEANIDDMNPQICEYLMERLFAEGAFDVSFSPLQMKKSRPGILIRVIVDEGRLWPCIQVMVKETTSIGIRYYRVNRYCLERAVEQIDTSYGKVRLKISRDAEEIVNAMPEYEDCKRISEKTGLPLKSVIQRILLDYYNRGLEEESARDDTGTTGGPPRGG